MIFRTLFQALALSCAALFAAIPAISLAEVEMEARGENERTMTKQVSAEIVSIDPKTRKITLKGQLGNLVTITAGPEIARFDEFAVGDLVVATYVASLSGELRAPTAAELAEPMAVLDASAIADQDMAPAAAAGLAVRAVCTIQDMNPGTRTVVLKDPEGNFHTLEDVDPAKMKGVKIGDTIIVTYTQAFALSLEKSPAKQ